MNVPSRKFTLSQAPVRKPIAEAILSCALALSVGAARAGLIDVNFANNTAAGYPPPISGAAALGAVGDQWNTISAGAGASVAGTYDLTNSTGTATNISLTMDVGNFDGGDHSGTGNQPLYMGYLFLDNSRTWGLPGPSTITLSGFAPGQPINLLLYADTSSAFTFQGRTLTPAGASKASFDPGNYVEYNGLLADSAGTISGAWSRVPGNTFAFLYGFQVDTNATAAPLGIGAQPADRLAYAGSNATFTVEVYGGAGTYAYQWYQNSTNLPGMTNATLTLSNVTAAMSGFTYHVTVRSGASSLTCSNATLSVLSGAQFIDVNFANNSVAGYPPGISGPAAIGYPGEFWNTVAGASGSSVSNTYSLKDTTGAASAITLNVTAGAFDGADNSAQSIRPLYMGDVFLDATSSYGPPGPSTMTLSGFGPGQQVSLFLYGSSGSSFTISNATRIPAGGDPSTFAPGNYAAFTNLAASADGVISCAWGVGTGNTFANLYGLQIRINTSVSLPVYLLTQPLGQVAYLGDAVTLATGAAGGTGSNYTYQWYQNGQILAGQTGASLSLNNVGMGLNGNTYDVKATDGHSSVTSSDAVVTVTNAMLVDANFRNAGEPLTISGAAAIGALGELWNTIIGSAGGNVATNSSGPAIYALHDTGGRPSGLSLNITAGTYDGNDHSGQPWQTLFKGYLFLDPSGTWGANGPSEVTISGIKAGETIDLLLYGSQASAFAFPTNATPLSPSGSDLASYNSGTYVEFDGLTPDSNGNVTGIWNNSGWGFLYGLQIINHALPSLTVDLEGGQAVIRWPTAATGFDLYSSGSLDSGAAWNHISSPAPSVDPSNTNLWRVSVPVSKPSFFRLRK